jgi:hypothetical protein
MPPHAGNTAQLHPVACVLDAPALLVPSRTGRSFLWTPTAGDPGRPVFYVSQRSRSEDRLVDLILGMVVRPSLTHLVWRYS